MKTINFNFLAAFLLLILLQFSSQVLKAQSDSTETVYEYVDEMPQAKVDYITYLAENVNYPKEAINNNIQGTVYASVIINKEGKICNIRIIKDIGSGCGEEVTRVLSEMPDWEPGKQNGKNVSVKMNIPVKFILQDRVNKKKNSRK